MFCGHCDIYQGCGQVGVLIIIGVLCMGALLCIGTVDSCGVVGFTGTGELLRFVSLLVVVFLFMPPNDIQDELPLGICNPAIYFVYLEVKPCNGLFVVHQVLVVAPIHIEASNAAILSVIFW